MAAMMWRLQQTQQWQHCRGTCCPPAWTACLCRALWGCSQTACRHWRQEEGQEGQQQQQQEVGEKQQGQEQGT